MLRKWVAACDYTSSTLVIPEAVVWELFAHYQEAERAAREVLGNYNRIRTRHDEVGVELPDPIDLVEFERRVTGTGARIWRTGGDIAIESIRDQILQEGAGGRKRGAKVGAADSAWLRTVYQHAGGTFDGVILVTGDKKAVEGVSTSLGVEPPTTVLTLNALGSILGSRPATSDQRDEALVVLAGSVQLFEDSVVHAVVRTMFDPPWYDEALVDFGELNWDELDPVYDAHDRTVMGVVWVPVEVTLTSNFGNPEEPPPDDEHFKAAVQASVVVRLASADAESDAQYFDILSAERTW